MGLRNYFKTAAQNIKKGWQKTKETYHKQGLWTATKQATISITKCIRDSDPTHALNHFFIQAAWGGLLYYFLAVFLDLSSLGTPIFSLVSSAVLTIGSIFAAYASTKHNQYLKRLEYQLLHQDREEGNSLIDSALSLPTKKHAIVVFYSRILAFQFTSLSWALAATSLRTFWAAGSIIDYIAIAVIAIAAGGCAAAAASSKSQRKAAIVYIDSQDKKLKAEPSLQLVNLLSRLLPKVAARKLASVIAWLEPKFRGHFLFSTPLQAATTLSLVIINFFSSPKNPYPFPKANYWATLGGLIGGGTTVIVFNFSPNAGIFLTDCASWARNSAYQTFAIANLFVIFAAFAGQDIGDDPMLGGFTPVAILIGSSLGLPMIFFDRRMRSIEIIRVKQIRAEEAITVDSIEMLAIEDHSDTMSSSVPLSDSEESHSRLHPYLSYEPSDAPLDTEPAGKLHLLAESSEDMSTPIGAERKKQLGLLASGNSTPANPTSQPTESLGSTLQAAHRGLPEETMIDIPSPGNTTVFSKTA